MPNETNGPLALAVDGLATYRLVKLVRDDRITAPAREALEERQGPPEDSKLTYLLNCPWCLSIWFAAPVAVVVAVAFGDFTTGGTVLAALGLWLGYSLAWGLAAQTLDADE